MSRLIHAFDEVAHRQFVWTVHDWQIRQVKSVFMIDNKWFALCFDNCALCSNNMCVICAHKD